MEKKINIYTCSGCEIGSCIDIENLHNAISAKHQGILCKNHTFLCGKAGLEIIKNDINNNQPEAIIIAACSPRVKNDEFNFGKYLLCERVNFREQLAWVHKPNDEDTQMLANDALNMAIAKLKSISIPKPYLAENLNADLLVVGGGITGITSAIEASKAGYNVVLIEKKKELGGWS